MKLVIPNSQRINRGGLILKELVRTRGRVCVGGGCKYQPKLNQNQLKRAEGGGVEGRCVFSRLLRYAACGGAYVCGGGGDLALFAFVARGGVSCVARMHTRARRPSLLPHFLECLHFLYS